MAKRPAAKPKIIKRNQLTVAQIKSCYKRVFSSSDGRVVLEDLEMSFLDGKSLYKPGMDALGMAHAVGARDLIVEHIGRRVGAPMERILVTPQTDEEE